MNPEFAQNPSYVSFERQLRKLHELIASGKGDSENADAVREAMAGDYQSLSDREVDRLNGLSEDLYSLGESEPTGTTAPSPVDVQAAQGILHARQLGNWAIVIKLLRRLTHYFPASSLAFQRYQAYAQLGHAETAYVFLRQASELDPTDLRKQHVLLDFSRKAGRGDEALAMAQRLLRDPATPPPLIIAAAHVRLEALRRVPEQTSMSVIREILTALEPAMQNIPALAQSPRSVFILGYTTMGFCREKLGDLNGAIQAFDQALALDPQSDALLVARGLFLARHDMDRAATEFEAAAKLGSRLFHPYLFLAPYELGQGRWAEARAHAEKLLARTLDPAIQADAQHWWAIAEFELGAAWPEVASRFLQAQRLDPFNLRITENFRRCQEAISLTDERSTIAWSRPGPDDFPDASTFWDLAAAA